jgi:hypothetical protein
MQFKNIYLQFIVSDPVDSPVWGYLGLDLDIGSNYQQKLTRVPGSGFDYGQQQQQNQRLGAVVLLFPGMRYDESRVNLLLKVPATTDGQKETKLHRHKHWGTSLEGGSM